MLLDDARASHALESQLFALSLSAANALMSLRRIKSSLLALYTYGAAFLARESMLVVCPYIRIYLQGREDEV